jgi:hypothetical protein
MSEVEERLDRIEARTALNQEMLRALLDGVGRLLAASDDDTFEYPSNARRELLRNSVKAAQARLEETRASQEAERLLRRVLGSDSNHHK